MNLNRRDVIAGVLALAGPRFAVALVAGELVLTAEKSTMPILGRGGVKTPVWRFMKDQPIAILRAKQGQEFKGRIINHNRLIARIMISFLSLTDNPAGY